MTPSIREQLAYGCSRRFGTDGMDVGMDLHAPVNHMDYRRPYPFTGKIEKVQQSELKK